MRARGRMREAKLIEGITAEKNNEKITNLHVRAFPPSAVASVSASNADR